MPGYTPFLNTIKGIYSPVYGFGWDKEFAAVRKQLGKDKEFTESVTTFIQNLCKNAQNAFQQNYDINAWVSLEKLLEKISVLSKNEALKKSLAEIKLMDASNHIANNTRHQKLYQLFLSQEVIEFFEEQMKLIFQNEKKLLNDQYIQQQLKALHKARVEVATRSSDQAAYSEAGRIGVYLVEIFSVSAEKLAFDYGFNQEVHYAEEEGPQAQKDRIVPMQMAAPPPAASTGPHR